MQLFEPPICSSRGVRGRLFTDDVALLAFAAERRAPVRSLRSVGRVTIDRYLYCAPGPQQQTRRSGVRRPNAGTDRQTDGLTPDRCIDPAPHTMRAVPIT